MGSAGVQQLMALAGLFKSVLHRYRPESIAVLGIAGGNGLEQVDSAVTKRIVGLDINQGILMRFSDGSVRSPAWNSTAAILPNEVSVLPQWGWYMRH